jgi:tripartite-type tricarboxylate transporter receptor subunit TctC
MKEKLAANGVEPTGGTPEQFRDCIRSESARFGKVIAEAGIKGESSSITRLAWRGGR